ncbi:RraA family protein [Actinomadura logoneensis]|uniref:Putative 4-hydroxy-4-methyl-2-oxoglutarate aldolase n=1 Tax=Actinomadura logoneensis TaxID=2293572 RepID=A0A372JIM3_9ACTN|nr:RraA family protein [Actinomadura logoneensis]RFU39865.1 RraA family protein [Actinomadura logoneensis]
MTADAFAGLTTAHVADACVRADVPVRCGPAGTRPVAPSPGSGGEDFTGRVVGRVLPTRHVGSVDVFLEAFEQARPGDVLVVDNGGRLDEACVGDLVVLEAKAAGLAGMVIWGLHRDTADIRAIGLPVFSLGSIPSGPLGVSARPPEALASARVGEWTVTREDTVFADDDGVLFVPSDRVDDLAALAQGIRDTERGQAERVRVGESLRDQLAFAAFLKARRDDPSLTFRRHLRRLGGAIEE